MEVGREHSPIVDAIERAEQRTSGEIRVHLSRRWFERDPYARARALFTRFGLDRAPQRNGVLLYVNLRRHRFAVYGDVGIHEKVGQPFWEKLAAALSEELHMTYSENAIAAAVSRIGDALSENFPLPADGSNPNDLPNTVTRD